MLRDTSRVVEIPHMLQIEAGAIGRVPEILDAYDLLGSHITVVAGSGGTRDLALSLIGALNRRHIACNLESLKGYDLRTAKQLRVRLIDGPADVAVAMGGGGILDVAKVAASGVMPLINVPTALSHDGVCSPVASLHDSSGVRQSVGTAMPRGVIIDPEAVLETAPLSLTAGLGDLLSNLSAVEDWRLAAVKTGEVFDEYAANIAEASALGALQITDLRTIRSAAALARGLVMSGLAMAVAGSSRPCSGAEHLISHALDQLLGAKALPHGHQVALGTAVMAELQGKCVNVLLAAFQRCGVPYRPSELGLTVGQVAEAISLAPSMRPGRYTLLSELEAGGERVRRAIEKATR